jgi:hypothetical protein
VVPGLTQVLILWAKLDEREFDNSSTSSQHISRG